MMTPDDHALLQQFAADQSDAAFAALVNRHLPLVHSAALRQAHGDAHLAEEIAQATFIILARKAGDISAQTVLTGWLYRTTQYVAADALRQNRRRQQREHQAYMEATLTPDETNAAWQQLAPVLDEAMHALRAADRDAVLLRYFENKSLADVGAALGVTEDAARVRVNRALEKLRALLAKEGIKFGAGAIAAAVAANAVSAAPATLAASITTAVLTGTSLTLTTVAMTTLQKIAVTAALTVTIGGGLFAAKQAHDAQNAVRTLQAQQAPMQEQIQQLQAERDKATNTIAGLNEEMAKNQMNNLELLQLRKETTALKNQPGINPGQVGSPQSNAGDAITNQQAAQNIGQELGMAVVRGEAGAFDKVLAEIRSEYQSFNTNKVGLDDQHLGELSKRTFEPANEVFKIIGDAAAQENQYAIDALIHAFELEELKGLAVNSFGMLAGKGDAGALDVLTHPDKYGVLLSDTISPLQPAADHGTQAAIDALAAIAGDKENQPLWYMTATSLTVAAIGGNPVAIDALINISTSTNSSVRDAALVGLRVAASNQNSKAVQALNKLGVQ